MRAPAESATARRLASAAAVVVRVIEERATLEDALQAEAAGAPSAERSALQAIAFGTIRWHARFEGWLAVLLEEPGRSMRPAVRALLSVALHQLDQSSHPPHAIVNEAVEAIRRLRSPRAAGLVNAVLRRFLRERAALDAKARSEPVGRFAHPSWLIDAIRADWPDSWQQLLDENNREAPLWLRVNRRRTTVEDYLAKLAAAGIAAGRSASASEAITVMEPRNVEELPGFAAGEVSVQDAAAQLAAPLLRCAPGMRVLDACAAPGGKACHLLERTPDLAELIALDVSASRLQRVRENLARLGLSATVIEGDARQPDGWWDGRPFDRILLDAPCSATGVIRRHPDIKVLRQPGDVPALVQGQLQMLQALWPLLGARGRLLYATCSVLRAENEAVVTRFLEAERSAIAVPVDLEGGAAAGARATPGVQLMPGEAGMDGFYYACLERREND